MASFHSPVDLIVFGKNKSETESSKELNNKLGLLEYALSLQDKAIREINFHQPMLGFPDGEMKANDGEMEGMDGPGQSMDLEDEEEETQPSSDDDDDAFIDVNSSSEEGSVRSNSF